jgi:hypothetical protein
MEKDYIGRKVPLRTVAIENDNDDDDNNNNYNYNTVIITIRLLPAHYN